jgi:MoaA/NifB/PqqE/SkfB family radical SAM enzyme
MLWGLGNACCHQPGHETWFLRRAFSLSTTDNRCLNEVQILSEWSPDKKWNPFNSFKLLAQVYRWRHIVRGMPIPQPALVTVDPINACDLKCDWCNAGFVLNENNGMMSRDTLMALADFLPRWQGAPVWPAGVEAICIAGGGEPLLHPDIGDFIERAVSNGIEVGVITNGTNIDRYLEPLSRCTWVGVSVDAGTAATYRHLKQEDCFDRVLHNIRQLTSYAAANDCRLGRGGAGSGVSYKYLLTPDNVDDIVPAARAAKALGCKNFHLRPAGIAWDKLTLYRSPLFRNGENKRFQEALDLVRPLEDETFGVYGITHKFAGDFNPGNRFHRCHAIFMTCVVMPPGKDAGERFRLGLCCDRRGDRRMEAPGVGGPVEAIADFWGSDRHWDLFETIAPGDCPRCTYQPHNQIMESVILEDSMTYKFI